MRVVARKIVRAVARRILPKAYLRLLKAANVLRQDYEVLIPRLERIYSMRSRGNSQKDDQYWAQLLRKYAHMIDKGIQRGDFEPGHSRRVYERARDALRRIRSPDVLADPSVVWAKDRIGIYERRRAGETYLRARPAAVPPSFTYEALRSLIMTRRSIRRFKRQPVTDKIMKAVGEVMVWAPSSCNRQPGRVYATNDEALVEQCLRTCKGATGFSAYVPSFLCFCADMRGYVLPREMLLHLIDVSLGMQNCALMGASLGLALTALSWAHHDEDENAELRRLLGIPEYYEIVLNAAMGYPEAGVEAPARKSVEQTVVLRSRSEL